MQPCSFISYWWLLSWYPSKHTCHNPGKRMDDYDAIKNIIWYLLSKPRSFGISFFLLCNLPKFRNFLGLSGRLGSGTDSSQYGEKNEMMNTKKIMLVRKTANFKERDAKNHSPNAIMLSLVSVGVDNVFWTDSLHYYKTLFTHVLKLRNSLQVDYIHALV